MGLFGGFWLSEKIAKLEAFCDTLTNEKDKAALRVIIEELKAKESKRK